MGHAVQLGAAILIAVALLAGYVALQVRHARHWRDKREWYRQHPAEFPSRRGRALRVLPFAVLLAGFTVLSAVIGRSDMVPLGVIGVGFFVFLIYRIATGREDLPPE